MSSATSIQTRSPPSSLVVAARLLYIVAVDVLVALYNVLTPDRPKGTVILPGLPGYRGEWPEYQKPAPGASRSPCPALNAMANHGILPRDGKNIPFSVLSRKLNETYNFAKHCRDYDTGILDLADFAKHNAIEHDASLCRDDTAQNADQSTPVVPLIESFLARAHGKLTTADVADALSMRRAECRATNEHFTLDFVHKVFGSSNAASMLAIFGGDVDVLRTMLLEERIPAGWEPHVRSQKGLSIAAFNKYVIGITMRIDEDKAARAMKRAT